jgi:hypothetical protein
VENMRTWVRAGLWLLPVYGVLTLLATLTHQPDPQTEFESWSEYVTTDVFLISHIFGSIFGAAVGILGLAALTAYLAGTRRSGLAVAGFTLAVIGSVFIASLFGIAAGAQPALGDAFLAGNATAEDLYSSVYSAPVFGIAGAGVLLFSLGFVLLGIAAAAVETLPRWASAALALAGPLIGIAGFIIGQAQTLGSALMVASGAGIALAVQRELAVQ